MDSERNFLFEIAPEERDGQSRKKGSRKKAKVEEVVNVPEDPDIMESKYAGETDTFLKPLIKECPCIQCKYPGSLIYTATVRGKKVWKMQCEWCLIRWDQEPIRGVLEEPSVPTGPVMRDGRFKDKTFQEIADSGNLWYIESIAAEWRDEWLKNEAQKWLSARTQEHGS